MTHLLGGVPESLEEELFEKLREIERNFRERRWEPAELNGGKLCEVAHTILRGHIDGSYPRKSSKPSNFFEACRKFEKESQSFGRSIRIQLPRMLVALYEIRNNRNVGHVGGDVDPNHMDAVCVLHMAKWIVSEFVRIFHGVTLAVASEMVEALAEREVSLVWDTGSVRRVLDTKLTMLEKTLVLLFASVGPVTEFDLLASLEYSNPSIYRRDVLRQAHRERLIEYDENQRTVKISPQASVELRM